MSKSAGTSSPPRSKSSSPERLSARDLAARVLTRVWQEGAFAAAALAAEIARHPQLDRRDVGLATELVYGVLRTRGELERRVAAHASSDRWRKQPLLRAHLCIGAYTLLALDRVPDFSAVDEAVEAIKRGHDRKVAGFANAVLRKIAREGGQIDPALALPAWLRTALEQAVGAAAVAALVTGRASIGLCLRRADERDRWLARLREAAPEAHFEAGALSPRAIVGHHTGDPQRLPGASSAWIVQEEGAQVVALLVGARAGMHVLDACAGRGGKTIILADEGAVVDAADLHPSKLRRLREQPGGAAVRHTFAVDWSRGSGEVTGGYDRILVDAPCSGTGTLRRRPEIVERLGPEDVARLSSLQRAIVKRCAHHLKPGAQLIYAVCSVLRQECEDVIDAIVADGTLEPGRFDGPLAKLTPEPLLRLTPSDHGTDGFFVACLRRPTP